MRCILPFDVVGADFRGLIFAVAGDIVILKRMEGVLDYPEKPSLPRGGGGKPRVLEKTAGSPKDARIRSTRLFLRLAAIHAGAGKESSMKIAIVGKGNVGSALAEGLKRAKHEIRFASREPGEPVAETVAWSDAVILAVPWTAHKPIAASAGKSFDGKIVVDVSNVLTPSMELAMGFVTSGAEELQKLLPKARIVKAFNTVFAQNMKTGKLHGGRLTVFIAGDDKDGKKTVTKLAEDIGFDSVDAGPLRAARYLEPLGMLNISLGYGLKMGTDIGFALIRKQAASAGKRAA